VNSDFETIEQIHIGEALQLQAAELLSLCRSEQLTLGLAESCTGGLVAGTLTAVPGSSDVIDRGYVTYSNQAKTEMLGVPAALIERDGAVSEAVALAMAEGVLAHSPVDIALALTGIAGPGGRETQKPVGLVHFAAQRRGAAPVHNRMLFGDAGRASVRALSVEHALKMLLELF
jgi:nicotinamide-nucleotide amidase